MGRTELALLLTETKTAFLNGNLQYIGISGRAMMQTSGTFPAGTKMGGIATYWDIDDDPAQADGNRTTPL